MQRPPLLGILHVGNKPKEVGKVGKWGLDCKVERSKTYKAIQAYGVRKVRNQWGHISTSVRGLKDPPGSCYRQRGWRHSLTVSLHLSSVIPHCV